MDQVIEITPGLMSSQSQMSIRRSKTQVFRRDCLRSPEDANNDQTLIKKTSSLTKTITKQSSPQLEKIAKQQPQQLGKQQQPELPNPKEITMTTTTTTTTVEIIAEKPEMKTIGESLEEPSILKTNSESCDSSSDSANSSNSDASV